ncbi:50S ribosomal protein L33 [Thalassorhabdus alkalitolerans]|uniref:Large ribosomal subunit protein bL33 n=1 Tax=Thalassorhabdus alkalitolerans TaxID=2282697 RepID=A0ABW0YNP2_9BACI|nr:MULTISPECIES: 50S ribosomal protein L33 [Bacillaceae]
MRRKVVLSCGQCFARNYTTEKKQTETGRIEVKKFCKQCNMHSLHRETK